MEEERNDASWKGESFSDDSLSSASASPEIRKLKRLSRNFASNRIRPRRNESEPGVRDRIKQESISPITIKTTNQELTFLEEILQNNRGKSGKTKEFKTFSKKKNNRKVVVSSSHLIELLDMFDRVE